MMWPLVAMPPAVLTVRRWMAGMHTAMDGHNRRERPADVSHRPASVRPSSLDSAAGHHGVDRPDRAAARIIR